MNTILCEECGQVLCLDRVDDLPYQWWYADVGLFLCDDCRADLEEEWDVLVDDWNDPDV